MIKEIINIKVAEIEEKIKTIKNIKIEEKKYNWYQKKITRRVEYEKEQTRVVQERKQIKKQIEELEEQIKKYKNTTYIQGFGLSLQEAIKILRDNGKEAILTENDLSNTYKQVKPDVDDVKGIILVHKTDHAPTNSRLRTIKEAEIYVDDIISIADVKIPIKIRRSRNTVHLSANGEVSSHFEGNWEEKKYAVLIPFTDVPRESLASVNPEDTYTVGGINLTSNVWILVPKGEKEIVQKNNPNVNVLEYEGKSVTRFADQLVKMLGYSHQSVDKHGWRNSEANKKYVNNMSANGYSFGFHSYSEHIHDEHFETYIQQIIQIMQYIKTTPEVLNDQRFVNELTDFLKNKIELASLHTKNAPKTVLNIQRWLAKDGFIISLEKIENISKRVVNSQDIAYLMINEIMELLMSLNTKKTPEEICDHDQINRRTGRN